MKTNLVLGTQYKKILKTIIFLNLLIKIFDSNKLENFF